MNTQIPTNSAAIEVRRRQEENTSLEEQIRVLRDAQLQNSEMIGMLSAHAQWAPSTSDVPAEPEPEVPAEPEPEEGTIVPDPEPESPEEGVVDNSVDNQEESDHG